MAEYLSDDEDAFAELLARKTDKELLREQKRCEEELQKAMTRNDTVSRLYVPTDFDTIEKAFSGVKTAEKGIE